MSKGKIAVIMVVVLGLAAALPSFFVRFQAPQGADADDAILVLRGATIYAENCASCHGRNLEGQADWRVRDANGGLRAPPHDESGHTWHHPDALLFDYTKLGGGANAPPGFQSNMPGFGDSLTDSEIWASLAYIKSLWPETIRRRQARINARR